MGAKMRFALQVAAGLALTLSVSSGAIAQTKLTIYTALENDQLAPYKSEIEKAVPGLQVDWVRDSTGVITARFLAEKANPKADMVLGLAASSLLLFQKEGLLETYKPPGSDSLKAAFRDGKDPYTWTGMDAFLSVVCFNRLEAEKRKAAAPISWIDLTKPEYKDQVVMPHPASSGTGYLTVAGWIQIMGEKPAWDFMDKLHENVSVYTHSGSAPCVQAAKGERMVGIGFDMRGAKEKTNGAPINIILPKEGAGWDMEAAAIVKGTKHLDAAKRVADWVVSKGANELYGKYYAIVAHSSVNAAPANYPVNADAAMVKNDFAWMAENRERILAEWTKRYDVKAQLKK
jgi:iron(III) transport system substrate-binding protein